MNSGPAGFEKLPAVDRVLAIAAVQALAAEFGRTQATKAVRTVLDRLRGALRDGTLVTDALTDGKLAEAVGTVLASANASRVRTVFNLTGTVLHTNLGRALLAPEAIDAMTRAAREPMNLEFDLATGKRGDRDDLIEGLVQEITKD
ncbi:MAG: hypothetical protein ABIU95_16730 [Burkholderiales bacterium]